MIEATTHDITILPGGQPLHHSICWCKKDSLDTPEAAVAHKQWELSKYTTQELKDELASREDYQGFETPYMMPSKPFNYTSHADNMDEPEQHEVCKHNMEMGYCEVSGCAGSY